MNINRSIFPYERMGGPFSGGDVTTEVASLSDIKEPSTNVIYKVPTINGFNKPLDLMLSINSLNDSSLSTL